MNGFLLMSSWFVRELAKEIDDPLSTTGSSPETIEDEIANDNASRVPRICSVMFLVAVV